VLDPLHYRPRTNNALGEHQRRIDGPNRGGSTSKVPMMTVPNAAKILRHDYYGLVRAGRARRLCPQPGRPARAREFHAAGWAISAQKMLRKRM
jgi:hypothetical protein